ncbi:TetR/AcrR family transcriptional regulator [Methylobacterium sp. sgz302541]|uniref:TetR/AcrR family transcriptional regulator n=1 Tax=unclassified Methylobacterium TaxID=2615210 RepID=UPI003D34E781
MMIDADSDLLLVEDGLPTTRCRILATAERFFREIGYQKTTVADIAKTLRMSPANVYRFFDSKKAINEAVVERVTLEIHALAEGIASKADLSAADRIACIVRALHSNCVDRCEANPRMHEMVEAAMTESWDVCLAHVERIGATFTRLVREGVKAGEFHVADPDMAARCLHTAITRYTHPMLVSQFPNAPAPPVEAMIPFLLAALGTEAGAIAAASPARH